MRIAIYDGILETHVGSSLERALIKRGHKVLNTGKIGHGFKFPSPNTDVSHLEVAVRRVVDFNPDVCFVMRPASLPYWLFEKIKRKGITTIAWLSDDPVLFDLSYGPVIDSYDLILHCGNRRVLEFYESRFQRPTGVNFPFWTDHEAFPAVWGTSPATTDLMFLGNVNDEVRRGRYFELAKLKSKVRIHGNVGADYAGLSGGYLDGDAEVVASGSTTNAALNIPQFFENHRGLETWFQGLDKLGYFEFPSRVVQYMAMGLPTISIIPGASPSESYPEMTIVGSIEDADRQYQIFRESGELERISESTITRFDNHFSADSRVLALESLLKSDDWKSLSSEERELWFTGFVPQQGDQENVDYPAGREVIEIGPQPDLNLKGASNFVVLKDSLSSPTANSEVVKELLNRSGVNVRIADPLQIDRALVPDPSGKCEHAVNVSRLDNLLTGGGGVLIVVDIAAALTKSGADHLRSKGYSSVVFADSKISNIASISRLCENYDLVISPNKNLASQANNRGFRNISFLPTLIHPSFIEALESIRKTNEVIRVSESMATETSMAKCFTTDISVSSVDSVLHYSDLEALGVVELAESLSSFSGTRQNPNVHRLAAYAVLASEVAFASRLPNLESIHPFDELTYLVQNPGEMTNKVELLIGDADNSGLLANQKFNSRRALERNGQDFLQIISDLSSRDLRPTGLLAKKQSFQLDHTQDAAPRSGNIGLITPHVDYYLGKAEDWWVRVIVNGQAVVGSRLVEGLQFLIRNLPKNVLVECEMQYLGSERTIPIEAALKADFSIEYENSVVSGAKKFPRAIVINEPKLVRS